MKTTPSLSAPLFSFWNLKKQPLKVESRAELPGQALTCGPLCLVSGVFAPGLSATWGPRQLLGNPIPLTPALHISDRWVAMLLQSIPYSLMETPAAHPDSTGSPPKTAGEKAPHFLCLTPLWSSCGSPCHTGIPLGILPLHPSYTQSHTQSVPKGHGCGICS
jgi:hypothetical protein